MGLTYSDLAKKANGFTIITGFLSVDLKIYLDKILNFDNIFIKINYVITVDRYAPQLKF
jgi:hypothetical protein